MVWMEERMNQMVKFGFILGAICLAATLVLAFTYEITKPKIDEQMRLEEQEALKTVVPEADSFKAAAVEGVEYFEALKQSTLIGYCVKVTGSGYGGYIRIIVGIDPKGVIKDVRILEHQETPGLGAKISEVSFLKQFIGKNAGTIAVKKDVDAITGATISSMAVTGAINKTVSEFLEKVKK